MGMENRYVTIKDNIAAGMPTESSFELRSSRATPLAIEGGSLGSQQDVLVKNLYLSVDPYQLNRMKKFSSSQKSAGFASRVLPGQAIDAFGVGRVVASNNGEFKEGDVVAGLLGWEEYTVVKSGGNMLTKVDLTCGFPLSYHASILGPSGLTAYAGFYDVCKPKMGEKVFVSAASGSVGSLVGQYAKLSGCYVVGCSGTKEKVDLLTQKLGFDDAFNYKEEPDLKSALQRHFPDGIDIYFDNVGGKMLEAAIANMNIFGRVAACGAISEYTGESAPAAPDVLDVIYKRITIRGFLAYDHLHCQAEFMSTTSEYLRDGKIRVLEHISQGLESIPSAFLGLFRGDNVGKTLIRVSD
ncbi:hypothetical protein Taro_037548 [Colocasia esculenta]|uniref:Enoyl reductase (ER) domain-containing protein n=1 Tax=Colocasia esculenta TaxID=4460 RepID=A0A843WBE4_COLES|nr:hypothetical protein [Colocasia esculenta]